MYKIFSLLLLASLLTTGIAAQKSLRLLSYNIRNGKGMDNQTDYDRTITVLQKTDADVIGLQELDSVTKRSNGADVLQVLASKTVLHAVYGAALSFQGGKYGVGVLSKEKPLRHYTVPLPGTEEVRALLVVEYKSYVVFNTHFSLTEADRQASVSIINQEASHFTKPIYLMGDLNAEPSSTVISALQQDWTLLSGDTPTFPAPAPDRCIDYIFSRTPIIKKRISTTVINEPLASDHRPVLVELRR